MAKNFYHIGKDGEPGLDVLDYTGSDSYVGLDVIRSEYNPHHVVIHDDCLKEFVEIATARLSRIEGRGER